MAEFQSIFKRYEKKYLLSIEQRKALLELANGYIEEDKFPKSTICSIYYDTPTKILIRNSIDKPIYKEKLRLRSYGIPKAHDKVFLELKKKFDGIVYKRRTAMTLHDAEHFLKGKRKPISQIEREIAWILSFYKGIEPSMFVSYDRDSYCGIEDNTLRITFDSNIIIREENLFLSDGIWGAKILEDDFYIMEIKSPYAIPLWLSDILDKLKIFPTSFSKYGTGYIKSEKSNHNLYIQEYEQEAKKFA